MKILIMVMYKVVSVGNKVPVNCVTGTKRVGN